MVAQKLEITSPSVAKKRGFFAKKRHTVAPAGVDKDAFASLILGK